MNKSKNLNNLLSSNQNAKDIFESCPDYIKDTIKSREDEVKTIDDLKNYIDNLTRADD